MTWREKFQVGEIDPTRSICQNISPYWTVSNPKSKYETLKKD